MLLSIRFSFKQENLLFWLVHLIMVISIILLFETTYLFFTVKFCPSYWKKIKIKAYCVFAVSVVSPISSSLKELTIIYSTLVILHWKELKDLSLKQMKEFETLMQKQNHLLRCICKLLLKYGIGKETKKIIW